MSQITETRVEPQTIGALVVSELRLMYGSKFAQQWQGLSPRQLRESWDQKLAGLTETEVRKALSACLTKDWPPTLPEFLRLCRPWMDAEVAHSIAVAGMTARRNGEIGYWPHPAIYWAAASIGASDLLGMTFGAIRARWEAALRDQFAAGQWGDIPAPAAALPAPGATVTTKDEGARKVQELAQKAIDRPRKKDHKAWARAVLFEQERKGGKRYTMTILDMARRALGVEQEAV